MVQGNVNLMEGNVNGVARGEGATCVGSGGDGGEWSKETVAELDQQDPEFEAERSQPIAAAGAEALNESFGAELAQVVAELAEAVVGVTEPVAGEDASVQLVRGPFANEATRIEQGLQQTDHPVVMQLQAGDAPQSNQRGFG